MTVLAEAFPFDFADQRQHMIDSQLRPNQVTDEAVLAAFGDVPREIFVPERLALAAYMDEDIEVAPGRFLFEPMVMGKLLQAAAIRPQDRVLEIGCNTGYGTAILTYLSNAVFAIDADAELLSAAESNLTRLGRTATFIQTPFEAGCPDHAPFDVIFVHGALGSMPESWGLQLANGGRMLAVVTASGDVAKVGKASLYVKGQTTLTRHEIFDANVEYLPSFEPPQKFSL
ncbi:MAG: protein-L-isoaspartate O-methyltransferase [Alphaproteobacteria bacterium]